MGWLWSDLGPIKKETISLFFVQKRTCTYCKSVKAGQGKGKEHWRRAVMSWQWSMQGAPYYHLLWNMSWWEKLFAKIIAFWFIPKNVDNFTKKSIFMSILCRQKDFTGIHKFVTIFWTSPIWWNDKKPTILVPAGFPKTARCDFQKIFYFLLPCYPCDLPCCLSSSMIASMLVLSCSKLLPLYRVQQK